MAVVRSPYAHAKITAIDASAAKAAEGVVAVFTGADLRDDWAAAMPCAWPVTEDMKNPEHFPLAVYEVRYQGDGVAVVIADSRAHAVDAAELVDVDYEPLDAIVDVAAAAEDGRPLVHEEIGTNVCYVWKLATGERRRRRATSSSSTRYYQPPPDPERDRAARRDRAAGAGRRRHPLVGDADPAHPPAADGGDASACPRRSCA